MADQPSFIPSAWAANNSTTETIPATTSESGKASWDQGFPVETSLPLSEGGIPPKYGDFNGILNVLSQFCLFAQAGGQFTWASTLSYSVGSIVVGSDGSIYRAVQATTNVNPVGDTSGKWERIVSKSDIDALEADIQTAMSDAANAVSNASAAQSAVTTLDANVVKLSGNQTVGGTKTFTSEPVVYTSSPNMTFKSSDLIQASDPNTNRYIYPIRFMDKNGAFLGYLEFLVGSGGNRRVGIATYKQDGTSTYLRLGFDTGGTPYITWNDKAIINGSDNQTVGGVKTFSGEIHPTNAGTWCRVYNLNTTKGTYPVGNNVNYWMPFCDKNGNNFASIEVMLWTEGSVWTRLYAFENKATGGGSLYLEAGFDIASSSTMFRPSTNGTTSLGSGGRRWGQIYSSNSTISTSDERLKQQVASIPDAVLDAWGEVDWRQFKFNSSVEEKGNAARIHTGLIAQHIGEVFRKRNLDASRYGLWCFDAWDATPEEVDDKGNVRNAEQPAGDMYSIRYEEALAMEAAYQRRRADRAEARISALERRLNEMEAVLASLLSPVGDETYAEPEQEQDAKQEGEE